MSIFDKTLVEKYLAGHCTIDEAQQVLNWLLTPKGEAFLARHIEQTLDQPDLTPAADESQAQQMLNRLKRIISEKRTDESADG